MVEPVNVRWNFTELKSEQAPLEIGDIDGVEFGVE